MRNHVQFHREEAVNRCAICSGSFGLVRHYSWRAALCSKKCVNRFRSREENDRRWLQSRFPMATPVTQSALGVIL
jgi:hypothetical protein